MKFFEKIIDMININGQSFAGRSIVIKNQRIIIDGVDITPDAKVINITVDGNLDSVSVDMCEKIIVNGTVVQVNTASGDVECQNVAENVNTVSGDVECGNVGGNVTTTSGDVKCENVTGSVKTLSGDIKHRK
jgi:hypothetical protein